MPIYTTNFTRQDDIIMNPFAYGEVRRIMGIANTQSLKEIKEIEDEEDIISYDDIIRASK